MSTARTQTPLRLFVFDLLHVDGRDLLDEPLSVRAGVMTQVLPPEMLVPRITADTAADITAFFTTVVADGFEGVVVKNLAAPYAAGRRDSGWIKIKPRHTFDLAVIAAEWGYGRREGWLSNLHLAARGPAGDLVMLGKTFKGLTDKTLTWQTEQFLARETRRTKSTVYRRSAAGRGDRDRRHPAVQPLSRRRRAAVRQGAPLPRRQVGRRGGHPGVGHRPVPRARRAHHLRSGPGRVRWNLHRKLR